MTKPHDQVPEISAEQGHVILDGPGNLALTMTHAAAAGTADKLKNAAEEAAAQASDDRRSLPAAADDQSQG